jgi:hypothetical protein
MPHFVMVGSKETDATGRSFVLILCRSRRKKEIGSSPGSRSGDVTYALGDFFGKLIKHSVRNGHARFGT